MRQSHESIREFAERLTHARSQLLAREPFLGFLALELPTHIIDSADHEVPTAATDGKSYLYNYTWCRQLTDPELVFVVAHEVAHVMFLHASRCEGREWQLWNAACDFAINGNLVASTSDEGSLGGIAAMPTRANPSAGRAEPIGLWEARFAKLPAEIIYTELLKNGEAVGANWDLLLQSKTEAAAAAIVGQARAAVAKALIRAKEFRKRRGDANEPGQWERWAEQGLRGTVRWEDQFRDQLLDWGGDVVSWSRPNRKYRPHGLYLPRYRGYQFPNILFAFDTSGSITKQFLGRMVAELNRLLLAARTSFVRVVCCDTKLHVIGDFSATRRLDPGMQSLPGGGGTDFRPVFDYAREQKSFHHLVYLTDAEGTFPDTQPINLRILWLTPEHRSNTVPFGEVISLPMHQ